MVYLYTEKKIRLIERGVCFLERSQYQRFLQFERLYIFITFRQTKCIFVTTKVKALISQNIREINFFDPKSLVGFYGDTLLIRWYCSCRFQTHVFILACVMSRELTRDSVTKFLPSFT